MNKHVNPSAFPSAVRAPSALPRRRWTYEEILKAEAAGVFDPDEQFELIDGEIVPMAAKGIRHENLREALILYWGSLRPKHLKFSAESPFRLSSHVAPEPDFMVRPATIKRAEVDGPSILLVVEVAASSRSRDLGFKAALYASFGVREYWVIEADSLKTTVHKLPSKDGYAAITEVPPGQALIPEAAPEMSVRLADLQIE